jgi:hypothetical protein
MHEGTDRSAETGSVTGLDTVPAQALGTLFQLLRDGQPRTRAQLAAETGLARSTITQRVDALLASKLITPAAKAASTGGRPPTQVVFNPAARVVLAADIGASHARLALTDLAGVVLVETGAELAVATGPENVLDWVRLNGEDLLTRIGRTRDELLGVGIGLPGPVEHSTGRPVNPPIMPGWDGFDVEGHLADQLGTVALVDNDVNIMALGEHFTHWSRARHLMYVKVATGIGSGLISDGRLHRAHLPPGSGVAWWFTMKGIGQLHQQLFKEGVEHSPVRINGPDPVTQLLPPLPVCRDHMFSLHKRALVQ